ncbi:MAG: PilZ domain-containing protein [Deltaproteobacteria bacterium]|nr:PilZ domain-containing protein [Deltaproteobacteria bacterium]
MNQCEDELCPESDSPNPRELRSVFTYPVQVAVLPNPSESMPFRGYLRDISAAGACVEFEDRLGRCNPNAIQDANVKISFTILEGEKVDIFARVQWVKKAADRSGSWTIGIEFRSMESGDAVDQLIGMKNKDRSMMWNLWEQLLK